MKTKSSQIKASVSFNGMTPADLVVQAKQVHDAMPNNPLYTGSPVDAATLEGAINTYIASAAQAADSKKAKAEWQKQRAALIRLLRQLAHFVEMACKDDMAVFMTSGFKPATYSRTAPQPLPPASIVSVDQGNTGQLLVSVKPLPKARMFEVRCAPVVTGQTPTWTIVAIPNAIKPAVLNSLTPGTNYTIQVRAYGMLGYTDWSDAVNRIAI
jgi:Fibronectin type III domain